MTMARRIKVSTMSLFVFLMIASVCESTVQGDRDLDLGQFRAWFTRDRLSPSTSEALSSPYEDDEDIDADNDDMTSFESAGGPDDQRLLYLLSSANDSDGEESGRGYYDRRDVVLRALTKGLLSGRANDMMMMSRASDVKASASKRSPDCMRKCMSQGYLHPSQCHSLC